MLLSRIRGSVKKPVHCEEYIPVIIPAYIIYRLVGKGNPRLSCILWGQNPQLGQLNYESE